MEKRHFVFSVPIILISVAALVIAAISVRFLGPNNWVEEDAEALIEKESGIQIELTPKAPSSPTSTPSPAK